MVTLIDTSNHIVVTRKSLKTGTSSHNINNEAKKPNIAVAIPSVANSIYFCFSYNTEQHSPFKLNTASKNVVSNIFPSVSLKLPKSIIKIPIIALITSDIISVIRNIFLTL